MMFESRPLLHPEKISAFGIHHHGQRRLYDSTTDVDGFAYDDGGLYLIIEHRTGGYNGNGNDNISARMLKRMCHHLGLKFIQVSDHYHALASCKYPAGKLRDSRHLLWMEYTADRPRGLYLTLGNPTPLGDRRDFWTSDPSDIDALKRLAERLNISFRIIRVNDQGIPSERDQEWLRSLRYTT